MLNRSMRSLRIIRITVMITLAALPLCAMQQPCSAVLANMTSCRLFHRCHGRVCRSGSVHTACTAIQLLVPDHHAQQGRGLLSLPDSTGQPQDACRKS
jgi:hypothetical protein